VLIDRAGLFAFQVLRAEHAADVGHVELLAVALAVGILVVVPCLLVGRKVKAGFLELRPEGAGIAGYPQPGADDLAVDARVVPDLVPFCRQGFWQAAR
jgi:hypothetical protein